MVVDLIQPKQFAMMDRYTFYTRNQKEGETVSEYIEELRRLSASCDFKIFVDEVLRDKFISGMNNALIRNQLLAEKCLTLNSAIGKAKKLEYEQVERKKKLMEGDVCAAMMENECFRCHSTLHLAENCRFKNITCHKCNMLGHLSKVCPGKIESEYTNSIETYPNENMSNHDTIATPYKESADSLSVSYGSPGSNYIDITDSDKEERKTSLDRMEERHMNSLSPNQHNTSYLHNVSPQSTSYLRNKTMESWSKR